MENLVDINLDGPIILNRNQNSIMAVKQKNLKKNLYQINRM